MKTSLVALLCALPMIGCAGESEAPIDADTELDAARSDAGGPCDGDRGGCDLHATCDDSGPVVVCTCEAGYAGDGRTCVDVAASLSGLRWELPCGARTQPELCRNTTDTTSVDTVLLGTVGTTYDVRVRLRGVIEPKTYSGGTRVGHVQTGGTPSADTANIYRLTVSAPAQTFFVNAGATRAGDALYCETIDEETVVRIASGATVTLDADTLDGLQIVNRAMDGAAFVVPGVPPAPAAFDGQFIQLDVISVSAVP